MDGPLICMVNTPAIILFVAGLCYLDGRSPGRGAARLVGRDRRGGPVDAFVRLAFVRRCCAICRGAGKEGRAAAYTRMA